MKRVAVVTGASSGIGAITARHLGAQGWTVAVIGRNEERTRAVAAEAKGTPFLVDFDQLDSVRSLASELLEAYPRIDVLLNNAGGLVSPRSLSADGHERIFQHNHLAPFLLTGLLRERLEHSDGRVVSTASIAHKWGHVDLDDLEWEKRRWLGGWRAYGTAKLETMLFMRELAKRSSLEAYSVHPGFVSTGFGNDSALMRLSLRLRSGGFGIPAEEGAVPLIRLATDAKVPGENGGFFDQLAVNGKAIPAASDDELAAALWDRTAEIVGLD